MLDGWKLPWNLTPDEFRIFLGIVASALAILFTLLSPLRGFFLKLLRRCLNQFHWSNRHYRKRFLSRHGKVRNIYLDRNEELDVRSTYVPLHINRKDKAGRLPALEVLADPLEKRLIIVGDPGTGKTTLVKAFATGILRPFSGLYKLRGQHETLVRRSQEIPFIVDLRHYSLTTYKEWSLVRYISDHVLENEIGMREGREFFRKVCAKSRCLLILDGLDEVSEDQYASIKTRITQFSSTDLEGIKTQGARLILTCRRQNFERLRSDWIPQFQEPVILAPLSPAEILEFIRRRKVQFGEGQSPEALYAQIQASGLADLHRIPLILTISTGLYINIPKYQIPGSIAKFYEEMIKELLARHDFRTRPDVEAANRFKSEDKYRFLRELALAMATRGEEFDEFSKPDLLAFFHAMVDKMVLVESKDADAFIKEIILHSGLLTRVSDDDVYIFAHRSIHEYFAAVQLARKPVEGALILLKKANDLRWRQVIIFFCALDNENVEVFIKQLSQVNLELAGHCIGAAQVVSKETALHIAEALEKEIREGNFATTIPSLASLTHCQIATIREMAMERLQSVFTGGTKAEAIQLSGLSPSLLVELLKNLALTRTGAVVQICVGIAKLVDDREERIAPLWQILANRVQSEQWEPEYSEVVAILLEAVMDEPALDKLQEQPVFEIGELSMSERFEAYPFKKGHDLESNLVTLLALGYKNDVRVSTPNEFLIARASDPSAFRSAEHDLRKLTWKIRPMLFSRAISGGLALLGIAMITTYLLSGQSLAKGNSLWCLLIPGILVPGIFTGLLRGIDNARLVADGSGSAIIVLVWLYHKLPRGLDKLIFFPLAFAVFPWVICLGIWLAVPSCATLTLVAVSLVSPCLCILLMLRWFDSDSEFYIVKPNPVVGMYSDPSSKHWISV